MNCPSVAIKVLSVEPRLGKQIYAIISVELVLAGIPIEIHGITARNAPRGETAIFLPQHANAYGEWCCSVQLPPELSEAVCDEVLHHLVRTGVGRARYQPVPIARAG